MTVCRDIIKQAHQFARIVSLEDNISAEEAENGLDMLQSMYDAWFAAGEFGVFRDVYVSDDYTAFEYDRVTRSDNEVITLPDSYIDEGPSYYPYRHHDFYHNTGKERAAMEFAAIEIVGVSKNIRENGQWVNINELTLDSAPPLLQLGKVGLSACLAIDIADVFGSEISQSTVRKSNRFMSALRTRFINLNERNEAVFY
jgi:hypothetical protein